MGRMIGKMNTLSNAEVINLRRVINGDDDGLMQIAPLKHPFADEIFRTSLKNNWVPQEVNLQEDIEQWKKTDFLSASERRVYKRSLAFVSNLDGIQTANLTTNIINQITSPEIILAIVRQAFEEALHVHSYATMIEALGFDPDEIYGMYKTDMELYEKNQYVLRAINKIGDPAFSTGTFDNDQLFLEACVGNIILEGIYFYSAFLNFYVLRRNNKMPGSAQMIQFINRDEDMHLKLFINIVNTIKKEQPELWTADFQERIIKNIEGAIEHELSWGLSCIGEGILGLNRDSLTNYLHFVGDLRFKAIGLPKKWNVENPFPWLDEITQGNMTESNFFESTVKEYSTGSLEW
ncbi:MAG: ribonucleotide-diphosphate reductase subunit beta [Candidatus Falkowbacteria bacterium]